MANPIAWIRRLFHRQKRLPEEARQQWACLCQCHYEGVDKSLNVANRFLCEPCQRATHASTCRLIV